MLGEINLAYTNGQVTGDEAKAYLYVGTNLAATEEGQYVSAPATYTITASAGAGGTISPSGTVTVNQGANQTFSITPNGGYQIASVTVDGVNQGALGSYTFYSVTANHTISAAFAATGSYTLTVSVGTGATGTPGTGSYPYAAGSLVSYSYAAQSGYTGLSVKLDGVTVAASGTVTMNAGHALAVTATPSGASYSVSGRVTYNGAGQASIRIYCGAKTATTDGLGNYTVTGLANGSYAVIPYYSTLTFYPVNAPVTIAGANVTGINFQMGRKISGTVTLNGVGLASVTVSTTTGVTTTTLSNGTYSLTGLAPATYTVTPSRAGYTFTPASRSVTVATVNITGINFTATQTAAPAAEGGAAPAVATPKEDAASGIDESGPSLTQEPVPTEGAVWMARAFEQTQPSGASTGWNTHRSSHGGGPGPNARDEEEEVYSPREAAMSYSAREAAITGPRSLAGAEATYYYWDHLGTTRMAAPEVPTAANVERHDYEPYGLEMAPSTNVAGNTHQFTGHERDLDTGLDNMHARFYAGRMGRFISPDDLFGYPENPQSFNLYSYVQGRTVISADPTGHELRVEGNADQQQVALQAVKNMLDDEDAASHLSLETVTDAETGDSYTRIVITDMSPKAFGERYGGLAGDLEKVIKTTEVVDLALTTNDLSGSGGARTLDQNDLKNNTGHIRVEINPGQLGIAGGVRQDMNTASSHEVLGHATYCARTATGRNFSSSERHAINMENKARQSYNEHYRQKNQNGSLNSNPNYEPYKIRVNPF